MLADGNGDYARALGLELDGGALAWGCAASVSPSWSSDGVAKHVEVEAPGQFKVSAAEAVLAQL